MSETDLAYIAGFFDGEGSIIIRRHFRRSGRCKSPVYDLQVQIGNTNPAVIEWIARHFDGHLYYAKGDPSKGWRRSVTWATTATSAIPFLEAIYPYVRMKREQIDIGLAFQRSKNKTGIGPYVLDGKTLAWREEQRLRIKELNWRERLPMREAA